MIKNPKNKRKKINEPRQNRYISPKKSFVFHKILKMKNIDGLDKSEYIEYAL